MEETLERLAFDLSVRALERQERVVEELRARTGTLLAAGAFVASLLCIRASGVLLIAGVVSALATISVSVSILLPNRRLVFTGSGTAFFEHFTRLAADVRETHRALAYWHASTWEANQRIIMRLTTRFEVACTSLLLAHRILVAEPGVRLTVMAAPKKPMPVPPPPGPPPPGFWLPERGFPKKK